MLQRHKLSKFYVNPTLLNAFTNGYDSLIPSIKREEREVTEAMIKGNEFEQSVANGEVEELRGLIDGALYQTFLYRPIDDYIGVLGFSDFIKYDTIYDTKYKQSYSLGDYKKSTQNLCYCYCADMDKFEYIIGVSDSIYYEGYTRDDNKLFTIVRQFLNFLDTVGLRKTFEENYSTDRYKEQIEKYINW